MTMFNILEHEKPPRTMLLSAAPSISTITKVLGEVMPDTGAFREFGGWN